jgi:hypothetical protein
MVKRVATRPIDQPDIGIGSLASVEIVALPRMQQAVGDTRRRDCSAERIRQNLHRGRAKRQWRLGNSTSGAVAETKPAAGQADLAERRGQEYQRPKGLLTVIGALDRP